MSESKYKAAIFDMDGTVLDTVEDMKNAVEYAMGKAGYDVSFTPEDIKSFFGSGIFVALKRAFKKAEIPADDAEINRVMDIYVPYYAEHCREKTAPYPGIMDLLKRLNDNNIKTAVVSNKPHVAVVELNERYFKGQFIAAVGEREREGIKRKPAPDMINEVLKILDITGEEAVYIGDSEVDIQTALNSGMDCISVTWGFRDKKFLVESGAKVTAGSAEEVLNIIDL